MYSVFEIWVCFCTFVFMTGNFVQASDDDSTDTSVASKQQGAGVRLGRGLQMLRLGKRSIELEHEVANLRRARSVNPPDSGRLSSNDVQAVLESIFDEPREESRRQPPLPRYGRDSSSNVNINGRILADALADDANIYPSDIFPLSSARFFFRPAPRGGRYRRSFPVGRFTFGDFISQDASDRAFALPRFASIADDIPHLHPKAVPRPRFGRLQNDQSDASFQSKSA